MEITEKNLENILDRQREKHQTDFERYIGALNEDYSSQLKGVADSVSGANKKLDAVMEMVGKNTEDIEMIKGSINLMQSDMDVVKSDISTIKFDLKNKVDLDEFKSLEKRVLFLERKVSHA